MAARFGEMLLDRRRQLGLSIQQVANTIKIRPQIIEFFETGNFASMPPRGYAQGMISTYARFLGLNPREVVTAYFDELMAYERETSQRGGRFQDAAGYVNTRSSTENGRFLMIEGGRSSRYGQRPPQAGYVTETGSGQEIREQRDRFRRTLPPSDSALPQSLGNVRDPRAGYGDGGYSARGARLASGRAGSDFNETRISGRTSFEGRTGRGERSQGRPYNSDRGSAGSPQRRGAGNRAPQQNRRPSSGRSGDPRMAPRNGARNTPRGRSPQPQGPQLDQRLIVGGIGVIAVLLVVIVVLLFRGCTPQASETKAAKEQTTQTAAGSSSTKSSSSSSSSSSSDSSDSSDTSSKSSSKKTEDTQVKVKVSVAKGKTAWIEIKVDGKAVYGSQATGPFEQEYTPESSIEITTSKPSDVTVTKNGEKVRYDTKTSGVARVTITVPKKSTDSSSDSASSDGSTSTDGTDAQSADGTSTDGSSTGSADGTTTDSSDSSSDYGTYGTSTYGTDTSSDSSSSSSAATYQ